MINNKSDNTCKSGTYNTNYLLTSQANEFLGITGLERNKEKSVIKYTRGKGNDTLLEGVGNDEDGVYEIKTKNIPRLISKGGTTLDGLIINISEESNLEEEKRVVQEAE
ncbi:hypothetical protein CWI39_1267p0010 [Hamiltosporidium magnivora]|uniref:Uncharacterized protein n=1 Tax=Hamiltosporidium magnivora TaxID=148818 RepID=A0A4Q9L4C0_9MICR|nr:hypothetical protein CWI39_1267p0010 [Hamiltosporidium magnivora]